MNNDRKEIIKSFDNFYHITSLSRWYNIQKYGLKPDGENEGNYNLVEKYNDCPPLCLSIPSKKYKWLDAIREKYKGEEIVVLEIPASVVIEFKCDIDESNSELYAYHQVNGQYDFKEILNKVGDLACFETITPCHIKCVERISAT